MDKYRLSNSAKEDLIRIHHFGIKKFGEAQADKYASVFNRYFGKYFIDKNAEMWMNEDTGELRKEPPAKERLKLKKILVNLK